MSDITQNISSLSGNAPDKDTQTPEEFSENADNFAQKIAEDWPTELNTFASQANSLKVDVNTLKSDTTAIKNTAEAARDTALSYANDAETYKNLSLSISEYQGIWSSLSGSLSTPASVYHDAKFWGLLYNISDVTSQEPGVSSAWGEIATVPKIRTPEATSPLNGDTGTTLTPTLQASTYAHIYSVSRDYRRFEIDLQTGDWSSPVYTHEEDVDNHTPSSSLNTETGYKWRCWDVDVNGLTSNIMPEQTFSTADVYIETPTITSPSSGATDIGETPTIETDTFNCVNGTDTHASSTYRLYKTSAPTTVVHESVDDTSNLTSYTIPEGVQETGTEYRMDVVHTGTTYGDSAVSSVTYTTKSAFAIVYGIALTSTGGGAGTWNWVDADGNNLSLTTTDFNNHAVWGGIEDVTIDGQAMVKIPKFYVKTGVAPAGSDQAGNKAWWVSDNQVEGFSLHPAFMDGGVEIDQVYIGKYECTDDGGTKAGSVSGASPLVYIDFSTMQTRCEARNEANGGNTGVDGFHLWSIYELSAVQLLALIELGTPDAQSAIAEGNVNSSAAQNTGSTSAVWRGIYELWGNVDHWTDGLQSDGSHQVQIWDTDGNRTLQSTGVNTTSSDGWGITLHDESGADWDLSFVFLPKTVDGTEGNGTLADYLYASDSVEQNVVRHGGNWSHGSRAGLFYLDLNNEASISDTNIGGRLGKW